MYTDVGENYLYLIWGMNGKKKDNFHEGSGNTAKEKERLYACE